MCTHAPMKPRSGRRGSAPSHGVCGRPVHQQAAHASAFCHGQRKPPRPAAARCPCAAAAFLDRSVSILGQGWLALRLLTVPRLHCGGAGARGGGLIPGLRGGAWCRQARCAPACLLGRAGLVARRASPAQQAPQRTVGSQPNTSGGTIGEHPRWNAPAWRSRAGCTPCPAPPAAAPRQSASRRSCRRVGGVGGAGGSGRGGRGL